MVSTVKAITSNFAALARSKQESFKPRLYGNKLKHFRVSIKEDISYLQWLRLKHQHCIKFLAALPTALSPS